MLLSIYDISAPVFRQYLAAFSDVLAKAEAHCAAGALSEAEVIRFRFREDMEPFPFQVRQALVHSAAMVGVLRGQSYPRAEGLRTLKACKAAVDAAVVYMDAATPADLSIDPGDDVGLFEPPGATMTASDFLLKLSYGHFFFHITTAYRVVPRHDLSCRQAAMRPSARAGSGSRGARRSSSGHRWRRTLPGRWRELVANVRGWDGSGRRPK